MGMGPPPYVVLGSLSSSMPETTFSVAGCALSATICQGCHTEYLTDSSNTNLLCDESNVHECAVDVCRQLQHDEAKAK